ncbi:hypothetical protein SM757_16970 [Azohydromonas lata]|uniref:Uncharacterized protein n=1 Tax=Azohydromonas lata TaxID=45677 RepID=A0ABU5IIE2_9BURK|nr:hypothetical protein [Azohydromonas lata]MDZ5458270.1 hypothetical protein [Azohydromonas lata]
MRTIAAASTTVWRLPLAREPSAAGTQELLLSFQTRAKARFFEAWRDMKAANKQAVANNPHREHGPDLLFLKPTAQHGESCLETIEGVRLIRNQALRHLVQMQYLL